ncbi:MAG: succinylglutamate desuccinylase [Gammaproteobacteria bacterium]|nr:succinylglutamate desuccinylase [Gammaproteobacteria bacterium]
MTFLTDQLLSHQSFIQFARNHSSAFDTKEPTIKLENYSISALESGVLLFEPENPGPRDIIISSAIHGNETAPIEICDLLVKEILKGSLKVNNRVLFVMGNIPAMENDKRFTVENLNRLFSGKHAGKTHFEAKRAAILEQCCEQFFAARTTAERCHFDLHTAIRDSKYEKFAIYPYLHGKPYNTEYLNLFNDAGINTILLANQPAGTFSYFTSHQHQSHSFTVELGKVKPFGENDMASFADFTQTLRNFIDNSFKPDPATDFQGLNLFKVVDEVMKHSDSGFSLNIDLDFANFSQFPIGFQLTTDDNRGYQMKSEQHAIVFPNGEVPIGNRVALIVEKTII